MFASTLEFKQVNFMRRFRGMSYDDVVEALEYSRTIPVNNLILWMKWSEVEAFQHEINELLEDLYYKEY